jgi:hypothetical protein
MWKNILERGRPQMTIWRMRIECWITRATNTHSQYVILIAFPLQQWLRERASILRYTYVACLVNIPYSELAIPHIIQVTAHVTINTCCFVMLFLRVSPPIYHVT